MPYSPARWPPHGRTETSRLLKVNHYMLDVRIKMRLGAYASPRQDTHYTGVGRSSWERPIIRGPAVLTSMCIHAALSCCPTCWALWAFESSLVRYKGIQGGFEGLWSMVARDWYRNRGLFSGMLRGVSSPCGGSEILIFLFRSRLVCSPLLHSPKLVEGELCEVHLTKYSEVPQSPDFVLWRTYISLRKEYAASAT
jgi:hypothetical protein